MCNEYMTKRLMSWMHVRSGCVSKEVLQLPHHWCDGCWCSSRLGRISQAVSVHNLGPAFLRIYSAGDPLPLGTAVHGSMKKSNCSIAYPFKILKISKCPSTENQLN